MARNGSDVYSLPAGSTVTSGTTISSTKYNAVLSDVETDLNTARPIVAGGTGATTAAGARTALGVASAMENKAATYTVLAADRGKVFRCTAALTLNLTAAATLADGFTFDVVADGGAVTIDPNSTETIDGATTLVVADGAAARVFCNGAAFYAEKFSSFDQSAVAITGGTISGVTISSITDLAIADGGTGAGTAAAAFSNLKQAATETATGVVEKSTSAENVAGTSDVVYPTVAGTKEMIDTHAAGGSTAFIATIDLASDATAEFTGFVAGSYDAYTFVLSNVIPVSDNVNLLVRTSSDGGSTYDSGAGNYSWFYMDNPSATTSGAGNASATAITIANNVGSAAGEEGFSGRLQLNGPHLAQKTHASWQGSYYDGSNNEFLMANGAGVRISAADVDAIQFLFSAGNLESGTITMYGIRNA